ncbi:nitroreductase family protein [Streptomyces sp. NBC_01089]|uniref:nitroreductase family protein n=1 Tax=Streptomyces sp. NBC_01089 TaxID=2903747 RepID=UPI00386B6199|nr:nitroreductase family protein [Streptomyces sp. NBC_01089]
MKTFLPDGMEKREADRDGTHEASSAEAFWGRMTLTAPGGAAPERQTAPPGIDAALRLLDAAWGGAREGAPAAPSAGALHPYECLVAVGEEESAAVYAADPLRRSCSLLSRGRPVAWALDKSGIAVPGGGALLIVVARPWLSMRKYGDRGYVYTQLDTAHFAMHLLSLTPDRDDQAALRVRLDTAPLAELLDLDRRCRFIHSVISLGCRTRPSAESCPGAPADGVPVDSAEWVFAERQAGNSAPSWGGPVTWLEAACWASVKRRAEPNHETALPATPGPLTPAAGLVANPRSALASGARLAELALRRESAKKFVPGALAAEDVWAALGALHTELRTDVPDETSVQATLMVRHVEGLEPGSVHLTRGMPAAQLPSTPATVSDEELVEVCMGQAHLRHAAALVLLHTSRRDLLGDPIGGIDRALFRAGVLGHLLYLGATDAHIGITAIGGFDSRRWRELAGLPVDHEVLYILVLGNSGSASQKLDRLNIAYAHNEG